MKLSDQLFAIINNEDMQDVLKEFGEVILDSNIDEGMIKEIPIIGTLVSGGKFFLSLRDRFFVKKLSIFFSELVDVSKDEKDKFLQKLNDEQIREKTGEHIILLIEQLDSFEKSKVVGILFKMYVEGKIDKDQFSILTHAIEKVRFFELHFLRNCAGYFRVYDEKVGEIFAPLRLVDRKIKFIKYIQGNVLHYGPKEDHVIVQYSVSTIGMVLVNVLNTLYE